MNIALSCKDEDHLSCAHATMRRLVDSIDRAETSEYQDSGMCVVVVGVHTDHWRQFVMHTDKADTYLESGTFSTTRPNGDVIFVVPVDDLPFPKVLNDEEQEALINRRRRNKD